MRYRLSLILLPVLSIACAEAPTLEIKNKAAGADADASVAKQDSGTGGSNDPIAIPKDNANSSSPGADNPLNPDIGNPIVEAKPDIPIVEAKPVVEVLTDLEKASGVRLLSMSALSGRGKEPVKGESVNLKVNVKNMVSSDASFTLNAFITSKVYIDYKHVQVGSQAVALQAGATKSITFKFDPFITDATLKKEYALGSGGYAVTYEMVNAKGVVLKLDELKDNKFDVDVSNVVLNAIFYNQDFMKKVQENDRKTPYKGTALQLVEDAYSRKSEIIDIDTGKKTLFPDGFDQMTGLRTLFKTFDGIVWAPPYPMPPWNTVTDYGRSRLGLLQAYDGSAPESVTAKTNHGFDFIIGLLPDAQGGGGAAALNTAMNVVYDQDRSIEATKIPIIHETAHTFGIPHCDTYGYVMCGGNSHPDYAADGTYVWDRKTFEFWTKGRYLVDNLLPEQKFTRISTELYKSVP